MVSGGGLAAARSSPTAGSRTRDAMADWDCRAAAKVSFSLACFACCLACMQGSVSASFILREAAESEATVSKQPLS